MNYSACSNDLPKPTFSTHRITLLYLDVPNFLVKNVLVNIAVIYFKAKIFYWLTLA